MKKYTTTLLSALMLLLAGILFFSCDKDNAASNISPSTGTGGSLARFIIAGDYLYVVDHQNLVTFTLANPSNPVNISTFPVGFEIETIFNYKDKLFIGSQSAMYIYSITDPSAPRYLGGASHMRACDPVVANDSVAYVTVRSGSSCGGDINALMVYDYKDAVNPVLRREVTLTNPQGLGLKDNTLFVCDQKAGLVVYALENNYYSPYKIATIKGETFHDCIPYGNILICMVDGGTALYDISDRNKIKQLAKIAN